MTARAILARFGLADTKLPGNYKVILEVLDRLSGKHGECWHGTATIARAAQCCERTVRNFFAAMKSLGVIEVIRDYRKTTRRRIVLLWKRASNFFGFMTATPDPGLAASVAASIDPPPDPPIEVPEGNTGESGGECAAPADPPPTLEPAIEADPAPPPPSDPIPATGGGEAPPKATPEQVATLVDRGREVLPGKPRSWFIGLARQWSLSWVWAAMGRAAQKRAEGCEVRPGYLIRTLEGFAADGGPPPELAAPPLSEAERDAKLAEDARKMEETFKLMDALGWK